MSAYPYLPSFEDQFDEGRQQEFIIGRMLGRVHTTQLVRVQAVRPTAGKVGFVDVLPMVQEADTARKVIEQSPVYNVPYMRYQGGPSAVVLDPAVGDLGLVNFAERDITSVKSTTTQGPPATDRRHDIADALYIGGVLNPEPTQYVRFQPEAGGIDIHSPASINITADEDITIDAGGAVLIKAGTRIDLQAPIIQNTATTSFGATAPTLSFLGNMSWLGYGGGAGTVTMANMNWSVTGGTMNFSGVAVAYTGGTFTYNGKNLTDTHTHGGVTTGGGTSGGVT
ncbi:MAG: hypothetical protein G4V63_14375 [Candidatus Afipia apatlaquensis]|uniref:Phage protein Gp138 N-terminal domain-containing protein n=1 Tax=Candidatus Afipia apatlaquensis TaxID=2712852 RepID=A0A7C9VMK4_9BRAD|nr:hypothetical protein [Candidatus Afipia apatlaquensis]